MATLYRAEALRKHRGRATTWRGRWHPDPQRAITQAQRWQRKEPFAKVAIVTHEGGKISLLEVERRQASEQTR